MKNPGKSHLAILFAALALNSLRASDDTDASSKPLIQVTFDHMVPTAYPLTQTDSSQLLQVSFDHMIPASYPVVQTNAGQIRQTIFTNLISTTGPAIQPDLDYGQLKGKKSGISIRTSLEAQKTEAGLRSFLARP